MCYICYRKTKKRIMIIQLTTRKGYIDREIEVDFDYTQGGDGYNEAKWRELRINKVYDGKTANDITDIIQRYCDISKAFIWDEISEIVNGKLEE